MLDSKSGHTPHSTPACAFKLQKATSPPFVVVPVKKESWNESQSNGQWQHHPQMTLEEAVTTMSARSPVTDAESGQSTAPSVPREASAAEDSIGTEAGSDQAESTSSTRQQHATALTSRLHVDRQEIAPRNTGRSYDGPQKEFLEFARVMYDSQLAVTEQKFFCFLWFTCYRDKHPNSHIAYKFSWADYD